MFDGESSFRRLLQSFRWVPCSGYLLWETASITDKHLTDGEYIQQIPVDKHTDFVLMVGFFFTLFCLQPFKRGIPLSKEINSPHQSGPSC